ncbi:MAG: DUF1579 family protein [Planctomycetes bacterium]|nr:DUF1579 family protein [Planctomycetota bacterium]
MRINRNVWGLLAVAGLAFAAGRLSIVSGGQPLASAQPAQDQPDMEMSAEMEAKAKAGAPGEHHQYLNRMIGEWEGMFTMWMEPGEEAMMRMPGTVSREWVLNGRYIRETVDSESEWGKFRGLGYMGYNNIDGQYEFIWMDTKSTAIMFETGTYDPESKVLTTRGSHRDPASGQVFNTRGILDLSNPSRHTYVSYATGPDGKEFKNFEGTLERKK